MKIKNPAERLNDYIKSQKGYEIARASFLKNLKWDGKNWLENSMANSYALLMVANNGNKDETLAIIYKIYKPENLVRLIKATENNNEPSLELIKEILN